MKDRIALTAAAATLLAMLPSLSEAGADPSAAAGGEEMILFESLPSVVGASKYEQKSSEAPASVSVITAEEIERYGYRTLADVLRSAPGLFVTYDRNYSYVGARGFGRPGDYNSRVLVLVDGHRVNDNVFGSALIDTSAVINIGSIQRVEIIRGPGSSLYGTNAFLAVVNVITKRGRDLRGTELSGQAASFQTGQGRAAFGRRFDGGSELYLSGARYVAEGQDLFFPEFDDPNTNRGWAVGADGDEYAKLFGDASFGNVAIEGAFSTRDKHIPTASFNTVFNDSRSRTLDQRGFARLSYDRELTGASRLRLTGAWDYYRYQGWYVYPASLFRDYAYGQWLSFDAQYDVRHGDDNKLIAGVESRYDLQQDQGAYDVDPAFTYLRDRRRSAIWALFIEDELQLTRRLALSAGVRHDHYATFGGTTNPRVGLIFGARERSTVKLLFGTAFRAPTPYENYYDDGGYSQKANPELKPERITTYEVVLENSIAGRLRSTASLYHYEIEDLVSLTTDPSDGLLVFGNSEEIVADGIELTLEGRLVAGWDGRLSYAYQSNEDRATRAMLSNSPRSVARANLTRDLWDGRFSAGVEMQYLGERRTIAGDMAGDYLIANLTLSSRPWRRGPGLSFSAYNLLDAAYGDPGGEEHVERLIPQDGRTYRFQIKYEF